MILVTATTHSTEVIGKDRRIREDLTDSRMGAISRLLTGGSRDEHFQLLRSASSSSS